MNLQTSADDISKAARKVFSKKTGKQRGLNSIEDNIRAEVEANVRKHTRPTVSINAKIDKYVNSRMKYMRNSFKKLNDPLGNRSDERATRIGLNETLEAKRYGAVIGHIASGKNVSKEWLCNGDCCDDCEANADDGPIPVGNLFSTGDLTAGAHPFCDCDIEYSSDDDDLSASLSELDKRNQHWIAFDFDGTLSQEYPTFNQTKAGPPNEKMLKKLLAYLKRGYKVKIFTARYPNPIGEKTIRKWCRKYIGQTLPITNRKDEFMLRLYDDKAVGVKTAKIN